jgi:hypothetical protein
MTDALTVRASHEAAPYLFKFANWTIRSSIPLPELEVTTGSPDWTVYAISSTPADDSIRCEWINSLCRPDGSTWLAVARTKWGYLLRFPESADFRINLTDRVILCLHRPVRAESIRHLLLDQALPLLLGHTGNTVLHASAVATPQGAIGFAARSGQGKSTLASFLSHFDWNVLTDDCLIISEIAGQLFARGPYRGVRLFEDSRSSVASRGEPVNGSDPSSLPQKIRLNGSNSSLRFNQSLVPLKRIYLLDVDHDEGAGRGPVIARLDSTAAFFDLAKLLFVLDVSSAGELTSGFTALTRLSTYVPCRRLTYQQRWDHLPEIRTALKNDLRDEP